MKKMAIVLAVLLVLTGCTRSNPRGQCVGVLDQKKPGVEYDISYWNMIIATIFVETLIVPAVVILKALECPKE